MRVGSVILFAALVFGAGPSGSFEVYTLKGDRGFEVTIPGNGSVVKGIFHALSPAELATWDLSTSGQEPNAPPGTHACADLGFNPLANCPFTMEGVGDQADAVAFRLSLGADSGPVSQTGPSFSPAADDAFGGGAYIISSVAEEPVPDGSSSGSFQFQNFAAGTDPQFFLQPGESTVWLLSRYEPGAVASALAGGATLRLELRDNSAAMGIPFALTPEVALIALPQNRLPNGNFDEAVMLAGWENLGSIVQWSMTDRDDDPDSGSALTPAIGDPGNSYAIHSCAPVIAGRTYDFGASVFISPGVTQATSAQTLVESLDGSDCALGNSNVISSSFGSITQQEGTWVDLTASGIAPAGSVAARLRLFFANGGGSVSGDTMLWDNAFVVPEPALGALSSVALFALAALAMNGGSRRSR